MGSIFSENQHLVILGTATTKIIGHYPTFEEHHPNITWKNMNGMRNAQKEKPGRIFSVVRLRIRATGALHH
jgi:uncharacterized protein with HEPN domain